MSLALMITLLILHVLFVIVECTVHRHEPDLQSAEQSLESPVLSDIVDVIPVHDAPLSDRTQSLLAT